jgi:exosortase
MAASATTRIVPVGPGETETTRSINPVPVFWTGALIVVCNLPVLANLVHQWHANEDMGHGMFVPFFAVYVMWERRKALLEALETAAASAARGWGLSLLLFSVAQLLVATLAAELFLQRLAVWQMIVGSVLYLAGGAVLRVLLFPLALLLFSIPIPGIALKSVVFPLQLLSSQLAETALELLNYTVVRDGNVLELAGQQLSVVEACSGIRAVLSLSFFSVCYGYLLERRVAMRWLLLAATVPVAILANATRIVATGILGEIDQKLATGFFHAISGWVIFVISVVLLIAFHKISTLIRPDRDRLSA